MRWFILAVLGGLGVLGTASAQQTIPMSPELLRFMSTPEEQRRVRSHEFDDWEATMAGCADTPNLVGATIVVYVAPKFDASGRPVSGRWRVMSELQGCGETKIFNLVYIVGPNRELTRVGTFPGTTAADPWLQQDGVKYAQMAMVKLVPAGCDEYLFVDTAFEALKTARAGASDPPWTEKWTIRACGVEGVVRLHFTPDATGTQITVRIDETVRAR